MMMKKIGSIIFSLACFIFALAYPHVAQGQLSGYEILKTEISARASGMGGAFVAMSGDLNTLFYNPAGLIGIQKKTLSFTYLDQVLDLKAGNLIFSSPKSINSKYALGINYINYGDFEGRDINGMPTSSFSAQDVVVVGGLAKEYSTNLFYGVSGKVLYSKIAGYSSTVAAVDGGVLYSVPKYMITFGMSLINLGYVVSAYTETKDDLPTILKGGVSKKLEHLPLLLSFEYRQYMNGDNQFVGGGEFSFTETLTGRFGYNSYGKDQKVGDEGGVFAGASFGFGFTWRRYLFDYSFSSFGVIGNLQRLTVSWTF